MAKKLPLTLLTSFLFILGFIAYFKLPNQPARSTTQNQSNTASAPKEAIISPSTNRESLPSAGNYKNYTQETVLAEQAAGNKVILFFHAPWCPYCIEADKNFTQKRGDIPLKVSVLKTDYDSNTELKKKYGVTYQHTFVQIDTNGELVTKWTGGDIDNIKKYLK